MPATLTGVHTFEIDDESPLAIGFGASRGEPVLANDADGDLRAGGRITWSATAGATRYVVYRNGIPLTRTTATSVPVEVRHVLSEYQVLAIDADGDESFLSEPVRIIGGNGEQLVKPSGLALEHRYTGFSGSGYLSLTSQQNLTMTIDIDVPRAGTYAIDARYANGSGPVNTEDKVAVRTLVVDSDTAGVLVMPQRGTNLWTEWGWTNPLRAMLTAGHHTLTLVFTPMDVNIIGTSARRSWTSFV